MSSSEKHSAASQIRLSPQHTGILRDATITPEALDACNEYLQQNHEKFHIFFRDVNAHNHVAHSLLSILSLGGGPAELKRAFDDGVPTQRAIPAVDNELAKRLHDDDIFYEHLGEGHQYHTYLEFFQSKIDEFGWRHVVQRYCFARDKIAEAMFARLFEGAYHPIIHLGLGIEFQQPSIVAEGLAQAASHLYGELDHLFIYCEEEASKSSSKPSEPRSLMSLAEEIGADEAIWKAPKFEERYDRLRNGIIRQAGHRFARIAAQYRVEESDLEARTAEMISFCTLMAGAAQKDGRKRKIDFFFMHSVTSSIFFSVLNKQDWISLSDRVRLLEWKGRLDLAFYAFNACPVLDVNYIADYRDDFTKNMQWQDIYDYCTQEHDDGHVAKFVRALRNGEQAAQSHEDSVFVKSVPIQGDLWLKTARMALGTTKGSQQDFKWLFGAGFEQAWKRPDVQ